MPDLPAVRRSVPASSELTPSGDVLLTGATGLVGSAVLAELLSRPGSDVICLVRADGVASANGRIAAAIAPWLDRNAVEHGMRRIVAVPGDVRHPDLGLTGAVRFRLAERAAYIVHCAASVRFDQPLAAARATNTAGVAHVLDLASDAHTAGSLRRAVVVSTAFVSGSTQRPFSEHELDRGQSFRTTYEQSKFEAECLARAAMDRLPLSVVRPSIVIGDSTTGRTPSFNVLYAPLRLLLRARSELTLPLRADLPLDIVPVDWVARLIVASLTIGDARQTVAAASGDAAPTLHDLAAVTSEVFGVPAPNLLPAAVSGDVVATLMTAWHRLLPARARSVIDVYQPYLTQGSHFDAWRGNHLMWRAGFARFDPLAILRRSLEYARDTDFGRAVEVRGRRAAARVPSAA